MKSYGQRVFVYQLAFSNCLLMSKKSSVVGFWGVKIYGQYVICSIISYLHIHIIGLLSVSLLPCIIGHAVSLRECQKSQKMGFISSCFHETGEGTQSTTCSICTPDWGMQNGHVIYQQQKTNYWQCKKILLAWPLCLKVKQEQGREKGLS